MATVAYHQLGARSAHAVLFLAMQWCTGLLSLVCALAAYAQAAIHRRDRLVTRVLVALALVTVSPGALFQLADLAR
jgi:hypothetical protein